ncbi:MFS transporter [Amycolatopsis thermalba]|uniref:MFS transporter n=1 Tax=Amycolatopsis thermalba TaxID=944492 RepID=A0ABY4P2K6_9PSEU|nr:MULTISPECIES: MFS transporter [Amycolatopsis]UQS26591.1 MFS transporter [Amycolatopsis thermalba]
MRDRAAALTALLTAEAMNLLDSTIVQVAAPAVHQSLPGPVSDIPWFSAAYTLPFAVLLITGGRLGDLAGRRRVFRIGVTAFLLTSLACALAPASAALIVFRAAQGAAAAVIIPQTIGLIRAMFTGAALSRALGAIGPVMGLAAVCGPVLGGVLTEAWSWRSAFLVNVPLSALVLLLARNLPEDRAPGRPRLDLPGTALAIAGTGLLVYPLAEMSTPDYPLLAGGVAVLVFFVLHQRRTRTPLVEPSLFAGRRFPAALVTSALFFTATSGLTLVVVLHEQLDAGAGVRAAGLTLVPWSAGLGVASWIAGSILVPRFGNRVMPAGIAVLVAGLVTACVVTAHGVFLGALGVIGIGAGLFSPAFFTAALHAVRPAEVGSAAGLLNAVQQLGATVGVALLGGVFFGGGTVAAYRIAIVVMIGAAGGSALMAGNRRSRFSRDRGYRVS